MINCQKCPNWALIEKAREACLKCDPDALSHHGASHVQATDYTLAQRQLDDHTPSSGCTRLSPEDEDTLRKAMTSLFGLEPRELLLVQHLFKGNNLSTFHDSVKKSTVIPLMKDFKSPRATASAMAKRIAKAFPAMAPVFKRIVRASYHPEANPDGIEGQLDAESVTPDLFEGLT